ncbi:hypothetical protein LPTSP4_25570 [Leptospira ryugenii]|uniref:Uncharacterized protein n=1 Tax=Leptospira ryugenii TaxID=1917863 RepID=A0A2P2E2I5_9LEPT|nr:hypothetical protein [Leptospira ryugenii]GBF51026.1 hypothetical protein LPTSP4_25570 [Leptospira ryugenii]
MKWTILFFSLFSLAVSAQSQNGIGTPGSGVGDAGNGIGSPGTSIGDPGNGIGGPATVIPGEPGGNQGNDQDRRREEGRGGRDHGDRPGGGPHHQHGPGGRGPRGR